MSRLLFGCLGLLLAPVIWITVSFIAGAINPALGGLVCVGMPVAALGLWLLNRQNVRRMAHLVVAIAFLASALALGAGTVAAQSGDYPLAGQKYEGWANSVKNAKYDAVWTVDGRLWQPNLPEGNKRVAHSVGITIEEGTYAFDGVECALYLDQSRNGKGSANPVTAKYGNDLRFSVDTADNGQAWALVECRGNFSSGFQIRWLNAPAPAATPVPTTVATPVPTTNPAPPAANLIQRVVIAWVNFWTWVFGP